MPGPGGVTPSSQIKADTHVPKEPESPPPTEDLVPETDDRLQGGEINLRSRQSHGSILHDQLLARLKETVQKKQPPAPPEGLTAFRRGAKLFFDALRDGKLDDATKSLGKTSGALQRLLYQGKLSELGKITDPGTAYDRWKKLQSEDTGKFDAWKKGHDAYLKQGEQWFHKLEEKHKKEALKFVRGMYGVTDATTDIGLSVLDAKNLLPRVSAFAQKIGVTLTVANGLVGHLENETRKRFRGIQKERVQSEKDSYRGVRNRLNRQQQIVRDEYRKLLEPHMKRMLQSKSPKLDPESKTPYTDRYELDHRTPVGPHWPR